MIGHTARAPGWAATSVFAVILAAAAPTAAAAVRVVSGTGEVEQNSGTDFIAPGDALAFAIAMDTTAADLFPDDPHLGLYPAGVLAIDVLVPGVGVRDFTCASSGVQVVDADAPGELDGVVFEGALCFDDLGNLLPELFVQLSDSSQRALQGDHLPLDALVPSLYDVRGGRVVGCRVLPCDAVSAFDFTFAFSLDTLNVPEPRASPTVSLLTLAALLGWRRRARTG